MIGPLQIALALQAFGLLCLTGIVFWQSHRLRILWRIHNERLLVLDAAHKAAQTKMDWQGKGLDND